ncbi:MAG TPA: DUF4344 domain-containing metallopeptidase [Polyangiales bacterium]
MKLCRNIHAACRRHTRALIAGIALLGSCADTREDKGDILLMWDEDASELGAALHNRRLMQDRVRELNAELKLPWDIPVLITHCGKTSPWYDFQTRSITMCYELLEALVAIESEQPETARLDATWLFVFLHEVGHALVHAYHMPVLGSAEDMADQFATLRLLEWERYAPYLYMAAEYWRDAAPDHYTQESFADEHSTHWERYYTTLCIMYGSNPRAYQELVTEGILPRDRYERCRFEYKEARDSWNDELAPWTKD